MFNSIAFDVVISLVFVYLLYSLLATIMGELISSWFGIRGRVLHRALERMLTDNDDLNVEGCSVLYRVLFSIGNELTALGNWFMSLFRGKEKKYTLAEWFYECPSIKYLTEGKKIVRTDRPSYISRDQFAETLTALFISKGTKGTDTEKISSCFDENPLGIEPETLFHLRNLLSASGNDVTVFTEKLKLWFDETMNRTTGWYKRRMRMILMCVGFLIAVSLNVDSIHIARVVSKDKRARDKLVELAVASAKDSTHHTADFTDTVMNRSVLDSSLIIVNRDMKEAASLMGQGWKVPSFSTPFTFEDSLPSDATKYGVLDSIAYTNMLIDSIKEKIGVGWGNADSLRKKLEERKAFRQKGIHYVDSVLGVNFVTIDSFRIDTNKVDSEDSVITVPPDSLIYKPADLWILHKYHVLDSIREYDRVIDSVGIVISLARGDSATLNADLGEARKKRSHALVFVQKFCDIDTAHINNFHFDTTDGVVTTDSFHCADYFPEIVSADTAGGLAAEDTAVSLASEDTAVSLAAKDTAKPVYDSLFIYGRKGRGWIVKNLLIIGYVLKESLTTHFWGFLITALMISCGAPFWFGLLQKLLALRGSGVKPEEITPGEGRGPAAGLPGGPPKARMSGGGAAPKAASEADRVADRSSPRVEEKRRSPEEESQESVRIALRIYGNILEKEKKVVAVFQGYSRSTPESDVRPCVQVNVEDADTAVKIRDKYGTLKTGDNRFEEIKVVVTGRAGLRMSPVGMDTNLPEGAIANVTLANGWGSPGCLVHDANGSQTYLLSCYHILNSRYTWEEVAISGDGETVIAVVNNERVEISRDYTGYFSEYLDVGLITINDQKIINSYAGSNPRGVREVAVSDILNTEVSINGAASGKASGIIVHENRSGVFDYPLNARRTRMRQHTLNDLIAISRLDEAGSHKAITQKGDSGSLVVDGDGNALGLVVGGDTLYTYAIKMPRILSALAVQLMQG